MAAQKSRGADMESGGLIKRVKALVPVLMLFIMVLKEIPLIAIIAVIAATINASEINYRFGWC